MTRIKKVLLFLALLVLLLAGLYLYYLYTPRAVRPELSGEYRREHIDIGGMPREYGLYLPAQRNASTPILFVLHGSLQTIEDIRHYSAYAFEQLAEEHGFIVVYPQGFERNWNDCRRTADYPARTQNIDDVGLIKGLIQQLAAEQGGDAQRVFLTGYSNGGHLGLRIALEQPELLAGVAAIAASLPTNDNLDCVASGQPVPVLLLNGTRDPINPYNGGKVTLFGLGDRGTVLSSYESAQYFAELAGYSRAEARHEILWQAANEPAQRVDLDQWRAPERAEVTLLSAIGGGHLLPQAGFRPPRLLGRNLSGFDGPRAIWAFFSRQRPVPAQP